MDDVYFAAMATGFVMLAMALGGSLAIILNRRPLELMAVSALSAILGITLSFCMAAS